MAISAADKIGKEICDVLGLKHCSLLDIHIAKNEIVTVTAKFYPDKDGVKQFPEILKKFKLVDIIETEDTTCIGDEMESWRVKEVA
jgi:hypothetical protein